MKPFAATWILLPLVACSDLEPVAEAPVMAPPAKETPAPIDISEPASETFEPAYSYSPIGKPDPFRPFLRKPDYPKNGLLPLQKWELDQLRLVAVVTGAPTPYAMVEDPKGRGHVVRRGDLIGKNWGRVSHIQERLVRIKETHHTYDGRRIAHLQELTIPRLPRAGDETLIDG